MKDHLVDLEGKHGFDGYGTAACTCGDGFTNKGPTAFDEAKAWRLRHKLETGSLRPSFDTYFLAGARWAAMRADCRRAKHGALIVRDRRVVATGYNGGPSGGPSCLAGDCPRGLLGYDQVASLSSYDTGPGACIAIHAEANALLHANRGDCEGATMYVTGAPCQGCRRLIAGSGVVRVVWPGEEWVL